MSTTSSNKGPSPVQPYDEARLVKEMESYSLWMDERSEEVYNIATAARSIGLDPSLVVEIPRAADLASRCEKLLVDHLEGHSIADEIRAALLEHDRETTAIMMAEKVAEDFRSMDYDLQKSIDVGLRVGLAILTEAVLVAPLAGISEVRLLNNLDGSQFLSLHFAGPIRAAGGTAQALGVLIADMIRRKLNIGRYEPTDPEVERVKEEFGLYRGNLQYRPSPAEIDDIVRACPVMINGEATERIECAGYGRVRNIDETRIRGGVLLVIGEGMCLKAPKIEKHTTRLNVPGWDFIRVFANRGKSDESKEKKNEFKSKVVEPITKFMKDIIAGRPVFSEPSARGGFRLRYGRARPSGLAAGSVNPATMYAMDDFLTIGTQMKIERPGKACAVTPSTDCEGPWLILQDGRFLQTNDVASFRSVQRDVLSIWDNGELVLGFGEFLENNKHLVASAYTTDWWASDILEKLRTKKDVDSFCTIFGFSKNDIPNGIPNEFDKDTFESFGCKKNWHNFLKRLQPNWEQYCACATTFQTSFCSPYNPWFKDYPAQWLLPLIDVLKDSRIEGKDGGFLRIPNAAKGWVSKNFASLQTNLDYENIHSGIGIDIKPKEPQFGLDISTKWATHIHGFVKASLLTLGLEHHHDGEDIVLTRGWEPLLDGLGFSVKGQSIQLTKNSLNIISSYLQLLNNARDVLDKESRRITELHILRRDRRIAAETAARQAGKSIAETERIGKKAEMEIPDDGPADAEEFLHALETKDEDLIHGSLLIVRQISEYRWEHSAPTRIGARMGRPEKAAPRIQAQNTHAMFPIELSGGNQRLLKNALMQKSISVQVGKRTCTVCGKISPFVRCHHKAMPSAQIGLLGESCFGRTEGSLQRDLSGRRRGEIQTIPLDSIVEDARIRLKLDHVPSNIKCAKTLRSESQTPEPIEKGILRALHDLPVFRDGTIRYDMSDVPITHFMPKEIGASWQKLRQLGYSHDVDGQPLENDSQMVEIYPQDFIIAKDAVDFFVRTAQFVDDLLVRYYDLPPYYNVSVQEDLIGQLICAIAPHTSGGVLSRIIGWTDSSGGFAHPMFHAAKRRNCDGDEDAILLLLDGLLNFSRDILPSGRGGLMDAPLVLTTRLNPTEVDKEALNVDTSWFYSSLFYEKTLDQPHPKEVLPFVDLVEHRLETVGALRGYGYTHDCDAFDAGPQFSAYKTLETMEDKMNGQLKLGHKLRSTDVRVVASAVIRSHFLPDLRGNLNAYARQKIRCVKCGHSYRRIPLAGRCIQRKTGSRNSGQQEFQLKDSVDCNGNLALTVSEGAVRKYMKVMEYVMDHYDVDLYTRQNIEWLMSSTDSLFNNDRVKQLTLSDFL
ncbi:MAG: hypothetical protein O3A74_00395 [archaeon]|nr:hypothetical protein [archaeon]